MKHRWNGMLWEAQTALMLCAAAVFPPGSRWGTSPPVVLPGLALSAAVPLCWVLWGVLAEPAQPLPPEQLLTQPQPFALETLADLPAAVP